jgi:hypothetical protein
MSAGLPTTFEAAIETMITYCVSGINNKSAALSFVITANRVETNPTTWSLFSFSG